jgi:hypothetical protein
MINLKKLKHVWLVDGVTSIKIGNAYQTRDGTWLIELAAFPLAGHLELRDVITQVVCMTLDRSTLPAPPSPRALLPATTART